MKIYIISLYSTTSPTRSRIFPDFANSSNVTQFTSFHISFVLAISGHVNRRSKWKYDNPTCTKNLTKFAILVFHSEISCALIITLKLKRKKWRKGERETNTLHWKISSLSISREIQYPIHANVAWIVKRKRDEKKQSLTLFRILFSFSSEFFKFTTLKNIFEARWKESIYKLRDFKLRQG